MADLITDFFTSRQKYKNTMKRDLELVRSILLQVESADGPVNINSIKTASQPEIFHHYRLLREAGLVVANEYVDGATDANCIVIERLTWAGHDFLAAARDDSRWKAVMSAGKDMTLDVVKGVLVEISKNTLRTVFGLSGGG